MKKIFTLFAVLAATSSSFAQWNGDHTIFNVTKNYVVYTTCDSVAKYDPELEGFAMEDCNFPFKNNTSKNGNVIVLTKDYTDPETGATFPAGYYSPERQDAPSGNSNGFFASGANSGMTNVKKVIFYVVQSSGSSNTAQFSSYYEDDGEDASKIYTIVNKGQNHRFTRDLNNKIMFTVPGYEAVNTYLADGQPTSTWTTLKAERPFKIVLDFTKTAEYVDQKIQATDEENAAAEIVVNYGNYFLASGGVSGETETNGKALTWDEVQSKNYTLHQSYKRTFQLVGFAVISATEGAETTYASIADSSLEGDKFADWGPNNGPAYTPISEAEKTSGHYFSDRYTEEYRQYLGTDGIENIKADVKASKAVYNIAGQQVGAGFRGIVIENGVKRVK